MALEEPTVADCEVEPKPARVHVWSRVAFAHLRTYRCGVYVGDQRTASSLCPEPPLYGVDIDRGPTKVRLAVCGEHAQDARASWDDVTAVFDLYGPRLPR